MIPNHLHLFYSIDGEFFRRQIVVAFQNVFPIDIEVSQILPIDFQMTGGGYFYSRDSFHHIPQHQVIPCYQCLDIIGCRVAGEMDFPFLHNGLLDYLGFLFKNYFQILLKGRQ